MMGYLDKRSIGFLSICWMLVFSGCTSSSGSDRHERLEDGSGLMAGSSSGIIESRQGGIDTATFAAGCFWCIEAQFLELAGVHEVNPGYTGGRTQNPTYQDVMTGRTGHAEAINVIYNSDSISFDELLEAFFIAHDPTQLNRQGNDVGTQYRSAVFYHNAEQKAVIDYYMGELKRQQVYQKPIVTEVSPLTVFYVAEDSHKNYYARNPGNPYCQRVIKPKLEKFKAIFSHKLKR